MRSIQARYISMREKYPEPCSSYICFVRTIRGQKYSYEMIGKWFNILVEKDNYAQSERNAIVKYLYKLSNTPEEKEF